MPGKRNSVTMRPMKRAYLAIAALCLSGSYQSLAWGQKPPIVTTESGKISGILQNGAYGYLGIPYAQPPVGPLRWQPPQAVAAWTGIRDGSRFGSNCYQAPPGQFGPYTPEFLIVLPVSEDCLYLNVWTPARRTQSLPVAFWIHGGGFSSGSASIPIYNGSRLAAKGVVVVGINYRLGAFGFLAHPDLTAESSRKVSGNYGLLDLIAGLRWVQENIASFGGDPAKVTIMGQSAGAMAANSLIVSPDAKGLFSAAIAESGSGNAPQTLHLEEAEVQGVDLAKTVGAHSLLELRAAPAEAILKASSGPLPGSGGTPPLRYAPVIDGHMLTKSPSDPLTLPVSNVPLLTGFNSDEVGLKGLDQTTSASSFERDVQQQYGALSDRILAQYPHVSDAEATASSVLLIRDRLMSNLILWGEVRTQSSGQRVYAYVFDHPYPVPNTAKWGSFHTAEVPYIFGALDAEGRKFTAADAQVSDQIQAYWINFMRRGDPNPGGDSTWPQVMLGSGLLMEIGDHAGVRPAVSSSARLAVLREARDAASPAAPTACQASNEQENRRTFNGFIDMLLVERKARQAFENYARSDLVQHNPAFGSNRESTILQYEKMFDMPGSRFSIDAVSTEMGMGIVRFHGVLDPTRPGANVTAFFRMDCGKIVEAWDILRVGN